MTLARRWLGSGSGVEAWWRDAGIELHLAANAPDVARMKMPADFFLSLAFSPDFKDAPFAWPNKPEEVIQTAAASDTGIAAFVAIALRRPDLVERRSVDQPGGFRAKLLQRVLDRKPYGEILDLAAAHHDRTECVRSLVLFMSEVQVAELPRVLELAHPSVRSFFGAVGA